MSVRIVDLTLPMTVEGMSVIAGNKGLELHALRSHDPDGRSSQRIAMSLHLGTHLDAPFHFDPDGVTMEEVDLNKFYGPGICLDLRASKDRRLELPEGLDTDELTDKIVLLSVGWSDRVFGKGAYYEEGPYLSVDAARALVAARPRAIGADFPVDSHSPDVEQKAWSCHRTVLQAGIPLIDNLTNLAGLIDTSFTFAALPLRLVGGDGSPTRAVALLED
jgi:arylformamidase